MDNTQIGPTGEFYVLAQLSQHGLVESLTLANTKGVDILVSTTVRNVPFTHVFSSHTTRALQTVEAVTKARGLSVVQLPKPGSVVDGTTIIGQTRRLRSNP